jgi:hypothetical protein
MNFFPRIGCALALALALAGCDSGSRHSVAPTQQAQTGTQASTQAAVQAPAEQVPSAASEAAPLGSAAVTEADTLVGRVLGAEAGSEVFLVRPDAAARDLRALADTIVDVSETDTTGRFSFPADSALDPSGLEVLVSAPGQALARAPLGQLVELQPEARLELRALDATGQPVELAFALVLDEQGTPLPVPVAPLVSDASGALQITRLPAGACEVIVASADVQLVARLQRNLASGQVYRERLVLERDDALSRRFLVIVGGPEVERALAGTNQEAGQ